MFFSFSFFQRVKGGLGTWKLWVRAIGVSSQWEGCEWEWGGGTIAFLCGFVLS